MPEAMLASPSACPGWRVTSVSTTRLAADPGWRTVCAEQRSRSPGRPQRSPVLTSRNCGRLTSGRPRSACPEHRLCPRVNDHPAASRTPGQIRAPGIRRLIPGDAQQQHQQASRGSATDVGLRYLVEIYLVVADGRSTPPRRQGGQDLVGDDDHRDPPEGAIITSRWKSRR